MLMFVTLPKPQQLMQADLVQVLSAFFLMKLGGQVSLALTDLEMLAHDYAGYVVSYDPDKNAYTLTLRLNPEEHPAPELRGPSDL